MFRANLLWKLYASYVLLILLTALVFGLLHGRQIEEDARAETARHLQGHATWLRTASLPATRAGAPDADFQKSVEQLGAATGIRFTVILESGVVLADSDEDPRVMSNHGDREEIEAARATRAAATAERYSATLREDMVYLAVPIEEHGELLGYARAAETRADVREHIANLQTNLAIAIGIVALLGCVLGFGLARQLTRRLRSVTSVAESMAGGDHGRRVQPVGSDEIGKLARAFNAMAEQLGHRIETTTKERTELRAILASMVEGVVAVDQQQRVVLINDEARRMLDTPHGEVAGRPIWELTRMTAVCEIVDLALKGARQARDEVFLPARGDRCLELLATQLRDEKEDVVGAVVVLHDITGLRHLERVRRDFVANVSHELKTPLTSIRGFVETLLDDDDTDPETRLRFLGKIRDHTHRLSALVTDLLALSEIESQGREPERKALDLREPVRASAGLLASRAEDKGIELAAELPDRAVRIHGDEDMLRLVVDNLIDNAIKYTPSGGTVGLRLTESEDRALLEVKDTGVGLEPHHQKRVFERFYRVDRARSRELGGTGLGLSIVWHVVRSHGGEVTVQSTPGAGTTFRVELPLTLESTG